MDKNFAATAATADATEIAAEIAADEQDAAGGITLKGRNRACARARVLAGMVLTSGLVITLSTMDTSVSAPR
ncbi:hypothetical protein FSY75_01520 [Streptomyces sp. TR1341]|uniref:Uncharacterized protein n=1 Tax=Streptomyces murinus TaxID=33900 RepID=A0A7W3NWK1_STRMR|nr:MULTISPECIES: hypothetical protein [Streptomyces]NDK23170.1 hypothetical protein [Streptomyces sp. TR1341]MBA9057726.1 hypothetical protein [Streptomyces murinus]UWW91977.1 hypothetical protein GO605_14875 [Streptomyces murinus]WSI89281.1 hypothetical protein OG516_34320 [Streptomyces murinus]WUD10947.1 hypothetical protein OG586_34215 [Streptomyces murinus]